MYKKVLSVLLFIALAINTSCAQSTEDYGSVEDLFSVSEDNDVIENIMQRPGQSLRGGWDHAINDNQPIVYDGQPVKIKVSVTMHEENTIDWSPGIACSINGVYQKLSGCGQEDATVLVLDAVSPGESREFELTLDPEVLEQDADKDKLKMSFMTCPNAAFIATEDWPTYGFSRTLDFSLPDTIELKQKPKTVSPEISTEYTEQLITDDLTDKLFKDGSYREEQEYFFAYQDNDINGPLALSEDGGLSFDAVMTNFDAGTYLLGVIKNNQLTTFNGGKEYVEISVKDKHIYTAAIKLDEVERGDTVQLTAVMKDAANTFFSVKSAPASLVVNSDFEFKTEPPADTAAPESVPDYTDPPSDTPEDPDALPILQNCARFGYYEQDGKRITLLHDVYGQELYYYDTDNEKVINKVSISDITPVLPKSEDSEQSGPDDNFGVLYPQITDKHIIVHNLYGSGDTEYYICDHNFNIEEEIHSDEKNIDIIYPYDDKHIVYAETVFSDTDINDFAIQLYISEPDGSDKKMLCELPRNYNLGVDKYITVKDDMLYSVLSDNNPSGTKDTPIAVDLSTGEIIKADFMTVMSGTGSQGIICAGDYALYVTGKPDRTSNDPGSITVFDKKQRKFRQIPTASLNESHSCTITPDGSKILALCPEFDTSQTGIALPLSNTYVRIYDTATGELISQTDLAADAAEAVIACGNEKFTVITNRKNETHEIGE